MFQEIPISRMAPSPIRNFTDGGGEHDVCLHGCVSIQRFNLSGNGEPERLHGEMISAGFFEILGVNPILGRTLPPTKTVWAQIPRS